MPSNKIFCTTYKDMDIQNILQKFIFKQRSNGKPHRNIHRLKAENVKDTANKNGKKGIDNLCNKKTARTGGQQRKRRVAVLGHGTRQQHGDIPIKAARISR